MAQLHPQADHRYRTHKSVKCYVATVSCGTQSCTWNFDQSIQRVVYRLSHAPGQHHVQLQNSFWPLHSATAMKQFVHEVLSRGALIYVGGLQITSDNKDSFVPHPYIVRAPIREQEAFDRLHP